MNLNNKLKILSVCIVTILFCFSCNQLNNKQVEDETLEEPEYTSFGEEISPEGAMDARLLINELKGKDSLFAKVSGKIVEVCKRKGCWMTIDIGNDEIMRVKFKDYGFFVPMNADELEVIMEGVAYMNTTSVSQLKHLAEDANKSQEEIDAITEPELNLTFEATGVLIKQ